MRPPLLAVLVLVLVLPSPTNHDAPSLRPTAAVPCLPRFLLECSRGRSDDHGASLILVPADGLRYPQDARRARLAKQSRSHL